MLTVLWWLIVGFVVGLLARAVTSGDGPRGFLRTSLFGIGGSLLGGAVAREAGLPSSGAGGLMMAVLGAVVLIMLGQTLTRVLRRRSDDRPAR